MLSFEEWAPLVYGWDGVLKRGYASASFPLYLMLKPHADLSAKMPDMLSHLKTYYWPYKDDHARELTIIPLTEVYLSNPLYVSEQIRIGQQNADQHVFQRSHADPAVRRNQLHQSLDSPIRIPGPGDGPSGACWAAHAKRFSPG